ncbi:LacI family DNA-binding transcriptional regulator [Sediminispirochaeta smaragdinae]|uniref:Transcriptional regulator, LacI family n=1 Tax=Sediminispirochaeta smaragdinae (strain DSM 11293 / JCM 15392 / SEBR 4228) TaxID=573413 RepID=E1R710_SEDSS|nr:LacI family DNA-binding transcriptional regulator [Sediminispirochaeta smaragdinae]ADK81337.1 transcriptional regulator, LacI family [Sediminispirochaeta smaragdinae DSM 11293]
MGVTIKDVAKRSGLSITTVSLVLNNKAKENRISEKTTRLITDVAAELNYSGSNSRKANYLEKPTKYYTIGFVVSSYTSLYTPEIYPRIEACCRKIGYFSLFASMYTCLENEAEYIKRFTKYHIDGIVFDPSLLSKDTSKRFIQLVADVKIPVVPLGLVNDSFLPNSIQPDLRKAGYMATDYLISKGFNNVACIVGPTKDTENNTLFSAGYIDALEKAKMTNSINIIQFSPINNVISPEFFESISSLPAFIISSEWLLKELSVYANKANQKISENIVYIANFRPLNYAQNSLPGFPVYLNMERVLRKATNRIDEKDKKEKALVPEFISPTHGFPDA